MKVALFVALFVLTPFFVIYVYQKSKIIQKVGTVIVAYAIGVLAALFLTLTPFMSEPEMLSLGKIQNWIMNISVPIAIPLMLFSSDFKLWTKSLPKALAALLTGIFSIVVCIIVTFFIFRNKGIQELPGISAMLTGIYSGGTMNFFAIGKALKVSEATMTLTLTFQMIVVFPFVLFLTGGGYKLFRKLLPFHDPYSSADTNSAVIGSVTFERYDRMLHKWVFPRLMLALLIAIIFFGIGVGISILITGKLNELAIILTITTLSIAASFSKRIRNLPKTFELGMFFILLFCVSAAGKFDVTKIDTSVLNILYFLIVFTLMTITMHVALCRVFKVTGDLYCVAEMGLFCSPPFIPPVVSAMSNRKVLISGVAIGLAGYAVGTYIGVALYYLFQTLL
ncbi:MAG: hypothetical protein H6Q25_1161 [Bacteroidetes bacterium]|nr:hypothetical protein [Bacteroidota bacterium]